MPSHEDLYEDMEQEEERASCHGLTPQKIAPRPEVDSAKARDRYLSEIAPVIGRRRRAEAGLPITSNPIKNLYLKLTGQDRLPEVDAVEPTPEFRPIPKK